MGIFKQKLEKRNGIVIMENIKRKLSNIPIEYRAVPFWSWNDKLEPEELRRQIRWMKENGIGGFFMHARGGLKTEYMSEEWMECIDACCDEAEKIGLHAWAYDENGWPSGFCGGKLLEDVEDRDLYILNTFAPYDPEADVSYRLDGETLERIYSGEEEGDCLNLYIKRSSSTVDILNPNVVKKFIANTHEEYKAYFGEAFADKFKGFFTDEPQFYRGGGTPFSKMVATYFKEVYGEDILDQLGLLFAEKKGYKSFRYRYWLAMQHLMLESYAKQVYEWCDREGIMLTGHYIEESWLMHQVPCCGAIMPFYKYEHIPGIDWLGSETITELGPRQIRSVASQFGKKRIMTETFAGCGWDASPATLARVAGFQYATGTNFMCHHLLPYAEQGQRKRDYPSHFSPINPWITKHFKDFNDYFTNLGYLLAEGEEDVKVAILHPIRSVWVNYRPDLISELYCVEDFEQSLRETCRTFSKNGIDYHFLDETLLESDGFVEGNRIGCGKCSYEYLILPKLLTMGKETEQLIENYVKQGGKILLLEEKPMYLEGEIYDYSYLASNCSLEEIIEKNPFQVKDTNNELYYAYRHIEGKQFLYVQNNSATEAYMQTFCFEDKRIQSFTLLDPISMETKQVPLTIPICENEGLFLFPSTEPAGEMMVHKEVELAFNQTDIEFKDNYLTLDEVRYSKDYQTWSEPIYVNTLFRKLLEEQYVGKLFLRYEFEVETVPPRMQLMAECGAEISTVVNGKNISFDCVCEDDRSFCLADITSLVGKGKNVYEIETEFKQSEETYYALFGENVTETLKNIIAYDSEIEAVYLKGAFGVYSKKEFSDFDERTICGQEFYIGAIPKTVTEPVRDGLPFFRGKLKGNWKIQCDSKDIKLRLNGNFQTAKVTVNGNEAGDTLWIKEIDVSPYIQIGENKIEVEYTISNRNLFGPFHHDWVEAFVHPGLFDDNKLQHEGEPLKYRLLRFNTKGGYLL